jgi:hypothetical protein
VIEIALEALTSSELLGGLLAGATAVVTVGLAGVIWRRQSRQALPLAGFGWAVACLVALERAASSLLLGVALLAAAGTINGRLGRISWLRVVGAAPGAWLIAHHTELSGPGWVPWLVFGVVAAGAPLMAMGLDHIRPEGLGIGLWVITVGGVYGTVPDTEELLVLIGASLPLIALVPFRIVSFGQLGTYPALGVLAWATALGGTGRPASIIGGLACVGALWLIPLARSLRPSLSFTLLRVVGIHLLVVFICSRVAGLRAEVSEAVLLALGAHVLGFLLLQLRTRSPVQGPV